MVFVGPFLAFMVAVFLLPLAFIFFTSFVGEEFTFKYYYEVVSGRLYLLVLRNTLEITVTSALATLLVSYPVAYHLSKQPPKRRFWLAMFVLLPFYTSILVKSFAFTVILGHNGIVNSILRNLFGPEAGVSLLFNRTGVIIGLTHFLIPFMVFPILASLLAQNPGLEKAAEIMGAGPWRIFWRVTFPLSTPGVLAGVLLCMILSMGTFVTPALLGGRRDMMIANLVDFHIHDSLDWNTASAIAVVLLLMSGFFILVLARVRGGQLFGEGH